MDLNIDQFIKWATFAGALVAAVSGATNLWWKARESNDKIKVGFGLLTYTGESYLGMHVVSACNHPIQVHEYGFIAPSGMLISVPYDLSEDPSLDPADSPYWNGSTSMEKRAAYFQVGLKKNWKVVGVYAQTISSNKIFVTFNNDVGRLHRLWLLAIVKFNPHWDEQYRERKWQFWRKKWNSQPLF